MQTNQFCWVVVSLIFFASEVHANVVGIGATHSTVMKTDGTVWASGENIDGQLGIGSNTDTNTFEQCVDESGYITGVQAVSVNGGGGFFTMLLKQDGTVWGAGRVNNGLGIGPNGLDTPTNYFVQSQEITDAQQVSAGNNFALVLKKDVTVWGTGNNEYCQLGDGTTVSKDVFVQARDASGLMSGIQMISAGNSWHSLALKEDGTLLAAGNNIFGALGTGTGEGELAPVFAATGITDVKTMSAGRGHSVALLNNGEVWGAGYNYYGQLGVTNNVQRNTFVQCTDTSGMLTGVQQISAGGYSTSVLKSDGTVWATGYNDAGQLGDGTQSWRTVFVQTDVEDAQSVFAGFSATAVVKQDNTLWFTGENGRGWFGDGTNDDSLVYVASNLEGAGPYVPEPWVPGPIPFVNDPTERAYCRQIQADEDLDQECNLDDRCAWNTLMSLCNERGYQPLVQSCSACAMDSGRQL